jgi:starch phosphorylase
LAGLSPEFVQVQLYADGVGAWEAVRLPMVHVFLPKLTRTLEIYEASIEGERPPEHFTPRIMPHHQNALVPSEEGHILWFR